MLNREYFRGIKGFNSKLNENQDTNNNAVRLFLSYNNWLKDKVSYYEELNEVISNSDKKIVLVIFNGDDLPKEICNDEMQWETPIEFAITTALKYNDKVFAIDIMDKPEILFAKAVLSALKSTTITTPLTVGCIKAEDNLFFAEFIDILEMRKLDLSDEKINLFQKVLKKPIWIISQEEDSFCSLF